MRRPRAVPLCVIRPLLIALLSACALLALPASGVAQSTKAPPGLSAADQYLETVPSSSGNETVVRGGQAPSLDSPSVAIATAQTLPQATVKTLKRKGESGKAAAALAGSGAPAVVTKTPLAESTPKGPLAVIGSIASGGGSDGIGILFPLLLVIGTLAVIGGSLWRRRSSPA